MTFHFRASRAVPFAFENCILHALDVDGEIAFLADEVGLALGYAKGGRRLATRITGELRGQFEKHRDYDILDGLDRARACSLIEKASPHLDLTDCDSLFVLYEPGMFRVFSNTDKPVARRLRTFLEKEILPTFYRVVKAPEPTLVPRPVYAPPPSARAMREDRLLRRVELDDRKFKAATLRDAGRALHELGTIDAESLARCEVTVAEIAMGRILGGLRSSLFRAFPPNTPAPKNETPLAQAVRKIQSLTKRLV